MKILEKIKPLTTLSSRNPFPTFMMFLILLVGLIFLGDYFRKPQAEAETAPTSPKAVTVYQLNGTPTVKVQAKIEKSGVTQLVAQTPGVVQKINFEAGDHVKRGQVVTNLSTNYQGGNALSVARKISQKSYKFVVDTFDAQVEAVRLSREMALKAETQASELRAIARQSIDETKSLISLNEDILSSLDAQIKELEDANVGGVNDAAIVQTKASKAQTLAALNGLKAGLRNTEYLSSDSQEPAELSQLLRDNTLKQLEIQEKSLQLNKDIAHLTLKLSSISESLMYPAAPCPGTIERVYVKVGQAVMPGTVIATIRGDDNAATAYAMVPGDVARQVSTISTSQITIDGQTLNLQPTHVSLEPTEGGLHSIQFSLPDEVAPKLGNGSYVEVSLPIGPTHYQGLHPYIPLDAVYYSQTGSYVYVVDSSTDPRIARNRQVTLGEVYGQYVEVLDGLESQDVVIVSRSVIESDPVTWN